jgi:hypothetical protein
VFFASENRSNAHRENPYNRNPVSQIFCTRGIFNAVPSIQAAMTKNAMEDLTSCLHYSDDWELGGFRV